MRVRFSCRVSNNNAICTHTHTRPASQPAVQPSSTEAIYDSHSLQSHCVCFQLSSHISLSVGYMVWRRRQYRTHLSHSLLHIFHDYMRLNQCDDSHTPHNWNKNSYTISVSIGGDEDAMQSISCLGNYCQWIVGCGWGSGEIELNEGSWG